jgi:hypothetical protein
MIHCRRYLGYQDVLEDSGLIVVNGAHCVSMAAVKWFRERPRRPCGLHCSGFSMFLCAKYCLQCNAKKTGSSIPCSPEALRSSK